MELENSFDVASPVDRVWRALLSFEDVAGCIPGARVEEKLDDRTFRGTLETRFGPVKLAFAGTVAVAEADAGERRLALEASGSEGRGRGSVSARVRVVVRPHDAASRVQVTSDVTLNGKVAQLSRGLLPKVSRDMTAGFASCLADLVAR